MNNQFIDKWLQEGLINSDQAGKMKEDISSAKKSQSQNRFIVAISTIGAVLLGIGAILFVASNWSVIPALGRVAIMILSTSIAYYAGYALKYGRLNFPKVGMALILLSTLLVGATLAVVGQTYNVQANTHTLILFWLLMVLPVAYILRSVSIMVLSVVLGYVWFGFYISELPFSGFDNDLIPPIFLIFSILIYNFGTLHRLFDRYLNLGNVVRALSLIVWMATMFIMTFDYYNMYRAKFEASLIASGLLWGLMAAAAVLIVVNFLKPTIKTIAKHNLYELGTAAAAIAATIFFFLFPWLGEIHMIIFNILIIVFGIILIYTGYDKEEVRTVNAGIFWISLLIIVRYFDFFWNLLDRSIFFLLGGLILVIGGIFLERNRRKLKEQFAQNTHE